MTYSCSSLSRIFSVIVFSVLGCLFGYAQNRPPALVVKQAKGYEEMSLTKLNVDVRIHGYLAETTTTMTFLNPHDRVLEGDLYFPLTEGSTVNGYALDIEGKMIDGVAVEKDRARQIFETVVRQGIDPGLVEWTRGNNFKTRIFPIPAKGSRTIRVRSISEIEGKGGQAALYRLPLAFKKKVGQFDLRIEVVRSEKVPVVRSGGPEGFAFKTWRSSFVAEMSQKDATLDQDLVIELPATARELVMMEKASDGTTYFSVHDFPGYKYVLEKESAPRQLAIFWDASGSRSGRDHSREIEALDRCLAHWSGIAKEPIKVSLTLLRNRPEEGAGFTIARDGWAESEARQQLLETLRAVAYDGGTNFGKLGSAKAAESKPDRALLFTDGLITFGKANLKSSTLLDVFSGDPIADHVFMAGIAEGSGGSYFNLKQLSDDEVVQGLRSDGLVYRGAKAAGSGGDEIFPQRAQQVVTRQRVSGKLKGDEAEIVLTYAIGERTMTRKIKVSAQDAVEGDLVRRHWAQTKLGDLLPNQKGHREEIVDLGKEHSLVTPFTSLLVLDSLEQYLEYRVLPPKSWPKVRSQYLVQIEKMKAAKEKTRAEKLAKVLPMWEAFCKWHGQEFKYPKDFRYNAEDDKKEDSETEGAVRRRLTPELTAAVDQGGGADSVMDSLVSQKAQNGKGGRRESGITLTPWDPKTPYLAELKKTKKGESYERYLKLRLEEAYSNSAAFYLDCAGFFIGQKQPAIAYQVLSNLAELELENPQLLRVLAHRLEQTEHLGDAIRIFKQVLEMRPEEPQSYRDLALVLIARAEKGKLAKRDRADYARAIQLLSEVVMRHWDRFAEIEVIALVEINRILSAAHELGITKIPLDKRLLKPIDCDMRITMTWEADNTDIDLHVVEPSGEEAFFSHNRTTIGGRVSRDFTQGYGPEEYMLRKAMKGIYTVKAKYYGSRSVKLLGGVTVQVNIFTNFGRPNQKCKSITVRLTDAKEMITLGSLKF